MEYSGHSQDPLDPNGLVGKEVQNTPTHINVEALMSGTVPVSLKGPTHPLCSVPKGNVSSVLHVVNIFLQLRSRHVAKSNVNSLSGNHEAEYWTSSFVVAIFNSYFITILLSLRRVANYFKMVHHPIQFYLSHRDYVAMIFFKKNKSVC